MPGEYIPTTFRLCAGDDDNAVAEAILVRCAGKMKEFAGKRKEILALILTGSFSRGEGSVLRFESGGALILGDMEFLVPCDLIAIPGPLQAALDELSSTIQEELSKNGTRCKIELAAVPRNYYKGIKPSIFNYELQHHGKVVYGDPKLAAEINHLRHQEIPALDGFNLLCNRIVEQLNTYRSVSGSPQSDLSNHLYQIVKLYLDMAGSYLVVSGRYAPSYRERDSLCAESLKEENLFGCDGSRREFLERVSEATAYKLSPNSRQCSIMTGVHSEEHFMNQYRQAGSFCERLWLWEYRRLFGVDNTAEAPYRYLPANGRFSFTSLLRDWLKFCLMAYRCGRRVSPGRVMRLFGQGNPRSLIYAAAAHLYFSVANGHPVDTGFIENILPAPYRVNSASEAIDAVTDCWTSFVRSA